MKKILSVFLTVCLMLSIYPMGLFTIDVDAEIADVTICEEDKYEYIINEENQTVTITGIKNYKFFTSDVVIPSEMEGYPVTAIENWAFHFGSEEYGFPCLENLFIPKTVTDIGNRAFGGSPVSIEVDDENPVYHSTENCLIEIETKTLIRGSESSLIPSDGSVTVIGDLAFSELKNIEEIAIPNTITYIGMSAFYNSSLKNIVIPDSTTSISGYQMFYGCRYLESIHIGKGLKEISHFRADWLNGCDNLSTITVDEENSHFQSVGNCLIETASKSLIAGCINSVIPSDGSVTHIDAYAFSYLGLTELVIPDGIKSMSMYAIYHCDNLLNIHIPKSLTEISGGAIIGCDNLSTITVDKENPVYHSAGNCIIDTENKLLVLGCTNSVIPEDDSVTVIGNSAFAALEDCFSISVPEGVTSITTDAFNVTGSISIELPNSLKYIGPSAFPNTVGAVHYVVYNGTEEEWNQIEIYQSWAEDNESIIETKKFFSDSEEKPHTISVEDIKLIKYADMVQSTVSHGGKFEYPYSEYRYTPQITVTLSDGSSITGSADEIVAAAGELIEGIDIWWRSNVYFYDDQFEYETQWDVGKHTVRAYFLGAETEFTVTVEETPVESIDVEPIELIENCYVSWQGHYDVNGDYISNSWYCYEITPQKMTVTFKDGSKISGTPYEIEEQTGYRFSYDSKQSYENQWGVGKHTVALTFMGFDAQYSVTIMETPIESIEVKPIKYIENSGGQWTGHWDENNNYVDNSWYYYYGEPKNMTVKFKDGSEFSGHFNDIRDKIKERYGYSYYSFRSDQSYEKPWGIGEHTASISVLGYFVECNIEIVRVEKFEIDDVTIVEETNGWYVDGNYYYNALFPKFTVELSNGQVLTNEGSTVVFDGWRYEPTINRSIQYDNPWTAGNTYEVTGTLWGVSDVFNVTIVPKTLESIGILSAPRKTQYIFGDEDFSVDGGKIILWYNNYTSQTIDITKDMVSGFDNTVVGIQTLTVTYMGKTNTFEIEVIKLKNGWVYENNKWAYYENNVKATNCWKLDSVGWCYLGSDGYMRTNSWIMDSQGWCYVGADGYCVTNAWKKDSYGWCYLNSEGRMATNSWILDSVGWCYVGADGYCVTNAWKKDSYGWCYLDSEGRMATNRWVMDSVGWCYVGTDGYAVTNCWKQDSVGWCYLNSEGSMTKSAWVLDGGVWYYLDGNGYMVTGWQSIGGRWYNFASNGAWIG